jgi:hypothetical protein
MKLQDPTYILTPAISSRLRSDRSNDVCVSGDGMTVLINTLILLQDQQ